MSSSLFSHGKQVRVLVVDDTQFYRALLSGILSDHGGFVVVGTAVDVPDAREKIKSLNPDVVTLDIEMPGMNGLDFLEKIMALRPTPVVIVSTLSGPGTDIAVHALQLGAVDCVGKPAADKVSPEAMDGFASTYIEAVLSAAQASVRALRHSPKTKALIESRPQAHMHSTKLIAIGSSTGGVEALTSILCQLPPECPPIVIAQHMPAGYTHSFATRLSMICAINVREASDGLPLSNGMAVVAPGGQHMKIAAGRSGFVAKISDEAPVNRHKPSVDVLFASIARFAAAKTLGIILTGMGSDGAQGLLDLRKEGAYTVAQNKDSCVVYGMPKSAVQLGAVDEEASLDEMPHVIIRRCFA